MSRKPKPALRGTEKLLAEIPKCPPESWPARPEPFEAFSLALRKLVTYRLSTPDWDVEPESWHWDWNDRLFKFEYGGRVHLDGQINGRVAWVTVKLSFAPAEASRHAELERLSKEAAGFRKAAERMGPSG